MNFNALKSGINKLPSTIKFFRGMAVVYDRDCVYVRAPKLFLSDEPDSYEHLRNLAFSLLEKKGFDCGGKLCGITWKANYVKYAKVSKNVIGCSSRNPSMEGSVRERKLNFC